MKSVVCCINPQMRRLPYEDRDGEGKEQGKECVVGTYQHQGQGGLCVVQNYISHAVRASEQFQVTFVLH